MKEFDLIPSSYRERIEKFHMLKLFAIGLLILFVTAGAALGAIQHIKRGTDLEIEKLTRIKEFTSKQRETLTLLKEQKQELDNKWQLLNGLRSATAPEDLFYAIDQSLSDLDIWFTGLKYERKEQRSKEEKFVETGYFVIITPTDENDSYAIGTTMTITGSAPNHSTLSRFVKNLLDQPSVNDAKVLETSQDSKDDNIFINFNIEILVNQQSYVG